MSARISFAIRLNDNALHFLTSTLPLEYKPMVKIVKHPDEGFSNLDLICDRRETGELLKSMIIGMSYNYLTDRGQNDSPVA